jgi:hypothetical protein
VLQGTRDFGEPVPGPGGPRKKSILDIKREFKELPFREKLALLGAAADQLELQCIILGQDPGKEKGMIGNIHDPNDVVELISESLQMFITAVAEGPDAGAN